MGLLNNKLLRKCCFSWIKRTSNEKYIYYSEKTKRIKNSDNKKRIFLLNTPEYANLGDHLITLAEINFLKDYFKDFQIYEITQSHIQYDWDNLSKILTKDDLLLITGGGFLGDVWQYSEDIVRKIIQTAPSKVIIMPQTIFFSDTENGKKEFLKSKETYQNKVFAFARDERSHEIFKQLVGEENCKIFPDMAIYYKKVVELEDKSNINQVVLCFRNDKEKVIGDFVQEKIKNTLKENNLTYSEIDTVLEKNVLYKENREEKVNSFFNFIIGSNLVITDRLHGMIFSWLSNVPCLAFDNNTHKVFGVYQVMKDLFNVDNITLIDYEDINLVEFLFKKNFNEKKESDFKIYKELALKIKEIKKGELSE